jgi:hypothetical protein
VLNDNENHYHLNDTAPGQKIYIKIKKLREPQLSAAPLLGGHGQQVFCKGTKLLVKVAHDR